MRKMNHVDVIIVLGAAIWPGGIPSPSLERRIVESVRLYRNKVADYLIFSGGLGVYPPEECVVMKNRAIALGIIPEKILIDPNSFDTFSSLVNCKKIMKSKRFDDAIIVTDDYHVLRCAISSKLLGIRCITHGIKNKGETPYVKWFHYHIREIAAIPWYVVKCTIYSVLHTMNKREYGP